MRLTKLGHSCLLVEENGARLLLDPGTLSVGFEELEGLTAVLFTTSTPTTWTRRGCGGLLDRNPRVRVVNDQRSAEPLGQAGVDVEVVADGEELDVGGVAVGVAGRDHAVIHPDIPVVPNVGYLVGGRLFRPGDAFTLPGQPVEVLAVPAGAPWLKVSEPIDYLRAVRPRVAVPGHGQVLSAAGRSIHYRQLEQLSTKGGTTCGCWRTAPRRSCRRQRADACSATPAPLRESGPGPPASLPATSRAGRAHLEPHYPQRVRSRESRGPTRIPARG